MKKTIAILVILLVTLSTFAQKKNKKLTMEVDGVCEMCKARIEKALGCVVTSIILDF